MKTILVSLFLLGLTETVIKPIIVNLFKLGIRQYIMPTYAKLDELIAIPSNWQHFVDNAEEFLYNCVIPEGLEKVDPAAADALVDYVIKNFDLQAFLAKQHLEEVELGEK